MTPPADRPRDLPGLATPARSAEGPLPGSEAAGLAGAVRAVAILSRHFERACVEMGLSLAQYRLLLWVRSGPRRAAELAERAAVRRPTLTALVDGLAAEGLLERVAVEGDRRGIRLDLTEKGQLRIARTEAHLGELLAKLPLGEQRGAILRHLALLGEGIQQAFGKG
jgi:MarR family transcriptional regulator for hemolysin